MPSSCSSQLSVAVFGGSFNPPHIGHLLAVNYVLACMPIDRVLVIPTFRHPFSKSLASFEDRLTMCKLAFAEVAQVDVSALEQELGGESVTVRTLESLHAAYPHWKLHLIVGSDLVPEMERWALPNRVFELAERIVLNRAGTPTPRGYEHIPVVLPDISSSSVRAMIASKESIEHLVPRTVVRFIQEQGLYQT